MSSNTKITHPYACKSSDTSGFSGISTISEEHFAGDSDKSISASSMCQRSNKITDNVGKTYLATSEVNEQCYTRNCAVKCDSITIRDRESTISSTTRTSQDKNILEPTVSNYTSTCRIGDLRDNVRKSMLSNVENRKTEIRQQTENDREIEMSRSNDRDSSAVSISIESNSCGSLLSNAKKRINNQTVDLIDGSEFDKPLRLFNKSGKPLTDRMGRPLINILGERLVVFDDKGRVISDTKGNQVFNSLGDSAIYYTTNLYIPPSDEEPGIPLLDITKRHILFLYDSKGHPLTDSLGRPLLCASGNPMLGMRSKTTINVSDYERFKLKNMYSRAPLESFVRYVQIFDTDAMPLTDDRGRILAGAKVICNKNGMPMCDDKGRPLYFKYGSRISPSKSEEKKVDVQEIENYELEMLQTSTDSLTVQNCKNRIDLEPFANNRSITNVMVVSERCISDAGIKYSDKNCSQDPSVTDICNETKPSLLTNDTVYTHSSSENVKRVSNHANKTQEYNHNTKKILIEEEESDIISLSRKETEFQDCAVKQNVNLSSPSENKHIIENETNFERDHNTPCGQKSTETIFLFDAAEKMRNQGHSSVNVSHFEAIKEMEVRHRRKLPNKMHSLNIIQLFKNAFSKQSEKIIVEQYQYNEYGKPLNDIYGNLLYDKYGMPLTGAQGKRLSDEARRVLRCKLRNVKKNKINITAEDKFVPLSCNQSHDRFGEPVYDKYGRPLYDLAGKLIYDRFGRPLTDAFGRHLVDAIGQPLMDCEGRVLTAACYSDANMKLTDIFGRKLYDKHGRALFDSYGRPKYDIFTSAIYDSCGRPGTDANGSILFDFLNKPIQPYPEKPLYKNARSRLPRYIETLLSVPSMYRIIKYSQPLEDVFGGPLFDDLGRPLYNKIGKPLFDRYGRPLYNQNGSPSCDCYGRPLSEDIKQSGDDLTLSVVDCLKLLKVTEESSKWMIGKNTNLKSTKEKNVVMKISYKKKSDKKGSGQYVYTLTRVTKFASGRQALEILEAPLSPSTVAEMHRLPVDNKPLIMVVGQRHKQTVK